MSARATSRHLTVGVLLTALASCTGQGGSESAGARVASLAAAIPAVSDDMERADTARDGETEALVTGKPCEPVAGGSSDMGANAAATIPLVEGLTLAHTWFGPDSTSAFDHECLSQVSVVDSVRVVIRSRCTSARDTAGTPGRTQLCRVDLREGTIYRTENGERIPELVAGSTLAMLSRRSFAELRSRGETPFRQVHLLASTWQTGAEAPEPDATVYVREDVVGTLRVVGHDSVTVQVNDSLRRLPVLRTRVILRNVREKTPDQETRLAVLDDSIVPLVLDSHRLSTGSVIRYTRITWPQRRAIEQQLAERDTSVVYGIYFDYNSAALRPESDVVLQEIAELLVRRADWSLHVQGHTDSIGGPSYNQALSERRAASVRAALVTRYGIADARLSTSGSGSSRPVDRNDTPDGRMRNRRVELSRR